MNTWADVKEFIGNGAPIIGQLIGGPFGGTVGAFIASALGVENNPDTVYSALKTNPNALVAIRKAELENAVELRRLLVEAERNQILATTQRLIATNTTMQAEAASEHWLQWSWRPFNGYVFGITLFCNYAFPAIVNSLILPWFDKVPADLKPGDIPEWVFITWAGVLGIMAAGRNQLKNVREGESSGGLASIIKAVGDSRSKK